MSLWRSLLVLPLLVTFSACNSESTTLSAVSGAVEAGEGNQVAQAGAVNQTAAKPGAAPLQVAANNLPWAQFRGPQGLGASDDKKVPTTWSDTENIVWKTPLPGAGTSSPILVGDKIYLTYYTGYNVPGLSGGSQADLERHLLCLKAADGKEVWDIKVAITELPEEERIREGHGYASSTLACDGERLYAFFGKSGAFAFDMNGKQLWRASVGTGLNGWGSSNSPVLYGDLVIINASVESESLVALNKNTGDEVWRAKGIKESWNTPVFVTAPDGSTELVLAIFGKVLGFDPKSGKQLWSCDTNISWYMCPSLVTHEGIVYCVGGKTGGSLAVKAGGSGDVTDTHRLWTGKNGSNVTSPVLHEGHLYWAHENLGIAYCAEAATGKILYEERLPRGDQVYASAVLIDGKAYYTTRGGKTFVVAAKPQFELLATNVLTNGGVFNASAAVHDGRLYIRADKYLVCIGK